MRNDEPCDGRSGLRQEARARGRMGRSATRRTAMSALGRRSARGGPPLARCSVRCAASSRRYGEARSSFDSCNRSACLNTRRSSTSEATQKRITPGRRYAPNRFAMRSGLSRRHPQFETAFETGARAPRRVSRRVSRTAISLRSLFVIAQRFASSSCVACSPTHSFAASRTAACIQPLLAVASVGWSALDGS